MTIYKITNKINGKIYIGKTCQTIKRRWGQHCLAARKNANSRMHLLRAINKYGVQNFKIEDISTALSESELTELECYFIKHYKSNDRNFGYNMTAGGEGFGFGNRVRAGKRLSKAHKEAISRANTNKVLSEETRQKIRLANTGRSWGRHSEKTKERIRQAHIGKPKGTPSLITRAKMSLLNSGILLTEQNILDKVLELQSRPPRTPPMPRGEKLRGIPRTAEVKLKISLAQKGVPKSKETCERMRASHLGKVFSPIHRNNISKSMKAYWQGQSLD